MNALPLSLLTALRFSKGRKRAGMVSLISVISTLGITLGVAVLIIGLSAMNGFERELENRVLSVVQQGQISTVEQPFDTWAQSLLRIKNTPGVVAASPYIEFTGLAEKGSKLQAMQLMGVDPATHPTVSGLPEFVADNAWAGFQAGKSQIILGDGAAKSLGVAPGEWLTIMIPNHDSTERLLQPKRIRLQVAGVFRLSGMLDHRLALIPLADAQQYLDYGEGVTGIEIRVDNVFNANDVVLRAAEASREHVFYKSWINEYGYMYSDIQLVRSIMYLAMILVIGVACFNIVSTLIIAVKDKSGDIAILRTLGAKDSLIRAIFLWYGLLTGMVGCISGAVLGTLAALNLTPLIRGIEFLIGHKLLSGDVYFIDFLPSELRLTDLLYVVLTTIVLSLLASWYPARRACRLEPARILSGQ